MMLMLFVVMKGPVIACHMGMDQKTRYPKNGELPDTCSQQNHWFNPSQSIIFADERDSTISKIIIFHLTSFKTSLPSGKLT